MGKKILITGEWRRSATRQSTGLPCSVCGAPLDERYYTAAAKVEGVFWAISCVVAHRVCTKFVGVGHVLREEGNQP